MLFIPLTIEPLCVLSFDYLSLCWFKGDKTRLHSPRTYLRHSRRILLDACQSNDSISESLLFLFVHMPLNKTRKFPFLLVSFPA